MNTKTEKLLDSIYQNKKQILIYLACELVCTVLRIFTQLLLSPVVKAGADVICWSLWAIIFYPLIKKFVFRYKAKHIYDLLKQIIIFILCAAAVYYVNGFATSIFYLLSKAPSLSVSLGGLLSELLCMFLMWKVVFKNK